MPTDQSGPPVLQLEFVQKVLLRVNVNSMMGIPPVVEVRKRKSLRVRDEKHVAVEGEALPEELTRIGRIRPGRRDTGEIIVNGDVGVSLKGLAEQLIAAGYQIVNYHVPKDSKPPKHKGGERRERFIPTFTLEYGEQPAENADELLALWNTFVDDLYTLFVYDNPDQCATFNCTNRGQTKKIRSVVAFENEILVVNPVGPTDGPAAEGNELASGAARTF